jgi:hypothetical protein
MNKVSFPTLFLSALLLVSCGESEKQREKRVSNCVDTQIELLISQGKRSCSVDPVFTKCALEYANGDPSGYCANNMKRKTYSEQRDACEDIVEGNAYSYEMQSDIIKMCR